MYLGSEGHQAAIRAAFSPLSTLLQEQASTCTLLTSEVQAPLSPPVSPSSPPTGQGDPFPASGPGLGHPVPGAGRSLPRAHLCLCNLPSPLRPLQGTGPDRSLLFPSYLIPHGYFLVSSSFSARTSPHMFLVCLWGRPAPHPPAPPP